MEHLKSPPFRISELEIEGFKSFGPSQKLSLGSLNFVVGANSSGKTNLISALRFLRDAVVQDVEFAVNEFGGVAEVRNKILRERSQIKPLRIRIVLDMGKTTLQIHERTEFQILRYDYTIILNLRTASNQPIIEEEILIADLLAGDEPLSYSLRRNKHQVEIIDPTDLSESQTEKSRKFQVPKQEESRLALNVGFYSVPSVLLRSIIADWRFYNISAHLARIPSRESADIDLGPSGENLGVVLHKLMGKQGNGKIDTVLDGLKTAVPGLRGIKPIHLPVEGKWAFQVLEDRMRGAINPDSVSDGTIRLLAMLVIANWTTEHSSLIAIEEPENGIHPHLSEHIIDILKEASCKRQLIVTTHNPSFLDYLEPSQVFLCDKEDGFTIIRRASDNNQVEVFRKRFRLGELWEQGALGGIP